MASDYPELVFGLVGAIGTELELVQIALRDSLSNVGYTTLEVKLSDLMRELPRTLIEIPPRTDPDYYEKAMDAGNKLRTTLGRADAMAALAMAYVRIVREKNEKATEDKREKRAYILTSLKRAEEVELLRDVYGASLFVISAYAPRAARVDRLAAQLAEKEHENRSGAHRSKAEKLILRDESEAGEYGQDVRKTYPLGDLFVNASMVKECQDAVARFVALIFGDPWKTPSRDEQGMALAYLASLRSGSPARQVGAALTDSAGNILAIGTNEVASPSGGQYWEEDSGDGRDVLYDRFDTSDRMRTNLLSDVLSRLERLELLKDRKHGELDPLEPSSMAFVQLRKAQLFDTIDFIRAVHAETAALLSSFGRSKDSILYVTTFPCHECARHIVFAGVKRVVYVEPYPKSLVNELYRDSIAVDPYEICVGKVSFIPFTGISPSIYQHLFSLTKKERKTNDGTLMKWTASNSIPRLHVSYSGPATIMAETEVLGRFERALRERGFSNDNLPAAT